MSRSTSMSSRCVVTHSARGRYWAPTNDGAGGPAWAIAPEGMKGKLKATIAARMARVMEALTTGRDAGCAHVTDLPGGTLYIDVGLPSAPLGASFQEGTAPWIVTNHALKEEMWEPMPGMRCGNPVGSSLGCTTPLKGGGAVRAGQASGG
jgi:hypothetical protein